MFDRIVCCFGCNIWWNFFGLFYEWFFNLIVIKVKGLIDFLVKVRIGEKIEIIVKCKGNFVLSIECLVLNGW